MKFELGEAIDTLERTPYVLKTLLTDLPDGFTHTNEGPDTWSAFDVLGHLIHGELTDWIPRTKIILGSNTDKNFIPFDRFAQLEISKGKQLTELLNQFSDLRIRNLEKLRDLEITVDQLQLTGIHPEFGTVTLSHLLSSWVVHDLAHIAQISRVMAKQYKGEVGPWLKYMGILT